MNKYEIITKNGIKIKISSCDKKELHEKLNGIDYVSIYELSAKKGKLQ